MKAIQRTIRAEWKRRVNPAVLIVIAAASIGCTRIEEPKPAPPPAPAAATAPAEKSSAQTLVDGFTGRTAVNAGQKARATIETVEKKQNEDLAEVDKF